MWSVWALDNSRYPRQMGREWAQVAHRQVSWRAALHHEDEQPPEAGWHSGGLTNRDLTGSFRTRVVPIPGASQHSLECGPRGPQSLW